MKKKEKKELKRNRKKVNQEVKGEKQFLKVLIKKKTAK